MFQKSMIAALGLSILAIAACDGGGRSIALKKTLAGGKTPSNAASTQNKELNDLVNGNKDCLPLAAVVANLSQAKEPFLIYVQTRTLVEAGANSDDLGLQFATLIAPLKSLSEVVYGSQLTSSVLIGNLLTATPISNCESVSFPKPGADPASSTATLDTFAVDKGVGTAPAIPAKDTNGRVIPNQPAQQPGAGATGRLTLKATNGELRDYRIIDGDKLVIDVTQTVPGAKGCNGNMPAAVTVKTRYVMNLAPDSTKLSIGRELARLLVAVLIEVPKSIEDAASNVPAAAAKGSNLRPDISKNDASLGGINIGSAQLFVLSAQIEKKQFKAICTK